MRKSIARTLQRMHKARLIAVKHGGFLRISYRAAKILFLHGWLGLQKRWRKYAPTAGASFEVVPPTSFMADFEKRQQYLRSLLTPPDAPDFSIITTVWRNTDPDLFLKTVEAVQEQSYRKFEWIVLRHGAISDGLAAILNELAAKKAIILHSFEENLGISGGMRFCLGKTKGAYVIPLDSDDLIISETLAVLARHIVAENHPDLCYTDEAWLNGSVISPNFRARFDPLLNFSASTVWHLMAFKREVALNIGIYSNKEIEYCHDWDTITRFFTAGKRISHVAEVVYLWRQHAQSTSNSGNEYTLSHDSQKAVLTSALDRLGHSELFEVEEFPIWRDTKEFRCRWTEGWPLECFLLLRGGKPEDQDAFERFLQEAEISDERVQHISTHSDVIDNARLYEVVRGLPKNSWCWVMNSQLLPEGKWLLEETSAWFTLLEDMDFLCGNIINDMDKVVDGGLMFGFAGSLGSPEIGHPLNWPGPYAMHLRPHSVDAPNPRFFAARVSALTEVLQPLDGELSEEELAVRIGIYARKAGKRIGWSSLLRARSDSYISPLSMDDAKIKSKLSNEEFALLAHSLWYSAGLSRNILQGWHTIYDFPQDTMKQAAAEVAVVAQLPDIEASLAFPINPDFTAKIEVRRIEPESGKPKLLIILPGVDPSCFTGGPNTAFLLAAEAAKAGYGVHALSVERQAGTTQQLQDHLHFGLKLPLDVASRFQASTFSKAIINDNDKIMATRYDTALIARSLTRRLKSKKFLYILQDFEPMFFPWGDNHALAVSSYDEDFLPIVCESLLADFFKNSRVGRFADKSFRDAVLSFEPTVDRTVFYPVAEEPGKRVLLFYARPMLAPRNLSNLGFKALSILAEKKIIHPKGWEVLTFGEPSLSDIDIGGGMITRNLSWLSFTDYAARVRTASVGLSLMLSPHTSYLPLELAACGIPVVTNCYANKTADALSAISPCIIGTEVNPQAIATGLEKAIIQTEMKCQEANSGLLTLPTSWGESFAPVRHSLLAFMAAD